MKQLEQAGWPAQPVKVETRLACQCTLCCPAQPSGGGASRESPSQGWRVGWTYPVLSSKGPIWKMNIKTVFKRKPWKARNARCLLISP